MQKKYNLLVPLAGAGSRMKNGGYSIPKPMIVAGDKTILEWGIQSIDHSECNLIFVIRQDHIMNFSIDSFLKSKFGDDIKIITTDINTRGSVESCYLAKDTINNNLPLIIFCPDVAFKPVYKPRPEHFNYAGHILTFKANSANYSYILKDDDGYVTQAVEKVVISEDASVGVYCFKTGKLFVSLAEQIISKDIKSQNEFYIAPMYNLITDSGKVTCESVEDMYIMGTPSEMDFFINVIWPYFLPRTFILCSDHSGYDKKQEIRQHLIEQGIKFIDCGSYSNKSCDYVEFIESAVTCHRHNPGSIILGFCRSGQGVNIAANKYKGIRSVLITDPNSARLGISHNAGNFFAIPYKVNNNDIPEIIKNLTTTMFQGGRHQNRVSKLESI